MIKIGILGYSGRMGQLIADEVVASGKATLAAGLVRGSNLARQHDGIMVSSKPEEVIAASDVIIDFTVAESMPHFAALAAAAGKAFVSGSTGFGAEGILALKEASIKSPVLHASNTSISLIIMKRATELAAKLFADFDYDVAIVEEHHNKKKDSPSGTAKTLADAVTRGNAGRKTPQFSSIRAGAIVGEHEVVFAGHGEVVRLHHSVTDRRIFARGAVTAALWLSDKRPGLYTMEDVLGITPG